MSRTSNFITVEINKIMYSFLARTFFHYEGFLVEKVLMRNFFKYVYLSIQS